jgi:hypothetical protein
MSSMYFIVLPPRRGAWSRLRRTAERDMDTSDKPP